MISQRSAVTNLIISAPDLAFCWRLSSPAQLSFISLWICHALQCEGWRAIMFLLEIMKHLSGSGLPSFLLSLTGHCYKCVFHQTSDKTKEVQHNVPLSYLKNLQSQNWIIKSFFSSTRKFLGKYLTSTSLNHKDFLHFSFCCHFRGGLQELSHFSFKIWKCSLFSVHPSRHIIEL